MEQQLLLKLLWINNEPTRMNMLRMFLQGPAATGGGTDQQQQQQQQQMNKLNPTLFLQAIAYHGKLTRIIADTIPGKQDACQTEMGILLQIAMNTRVALVELHGDQSPIVVAFQDGLSPVFS